MHVLLAILFAIAPYAPMMPFIGATCDARCGRNVAPAGAVETSEPAPLRACCAAAMNAGSLAPKALPRSTTSGSSATCNGTCCGATCSCGPGCTCRVDRAPPASPLPAPPLPAAPNCDHFALAARSTAPLVCPFLAAPATGRLQAHRVVAGGDPAAFGRDRLLCTGTFVV